MPNCFSCIWPRLKVLAALFFLALSAPAPGQVTEAIARVGILAHRGPDAAVSDWLPLMDYLSASIEGRRFELVPVTLISAAEKVSAGEIDFLITNPGHFVTLAEAYPVSAIATRKRDVDTTSSGLSTYGTAVLVRSDSEIKSITDLRDKRVAAVSRDAFGGFQIAWSEMRAHGVDAFRDLAGLSFMGFPQDAIANAVARGDFDAGIVRSGLLERLEAEGQIARNQLGVLNSHSQPDYPYRITGHLYPEWPFVSVPGVSKDLTDAVLIALLRTQDAAVQAGFGLRDSWSSPASYEVVRKLVSEFHASSEAGSGPLTQPLSWALALAMVCAGLFAIINRGKPVFGGAKAPNQVKDR